MTEKKEEVKEDVVVEDVKIEDLDPEEKDYLKDVLPDNEESTEDVKDTPSEDKPEDLKDVKEDDKKEAKDDKSDKDSELPYKINEDGTVVVGKKEFPTVEAAMKSYFNLEKVHGTQAKELGELRSQAVLGEQEIVDDKKEKVEEISAEEVNLYDPDELKKFVIRVSQATSKDTTSTTITDMVEKTQRQQALVDFAKANPTLDTKNLQEIAKFAGDNGITDWNTAFKYMRYDENIEAAEKTGRDKTLAEFKIKSPDASLSNIKGSGDSDILPDGKEISQAQFNKLSKEDQDKLLKAA